MTHVPHAPLDRQIPILFLGDNPALSTGLARIGRDLATQLTRMPQFRVGYLGRGEIADRRLPFTQYTFAPTSADQWGMSVLPDVWYNFAGSAPADRGVIFTVWDPSRLVGFSSQQMRCTGYDDLDVFLASGQFERWGYFAIDSLGPHEGGALPHILADTLRGYDRILAYSQFGKRVLDATLPDRADEIEWAPHGFNASVFAPPADEMKRVEARLHMAQVMRIDVAPQHKLVGCVMSNQARKDWGLWADTMRRVRHEEPSLLLWGHTDSVDNYWDMRLLVDEFGLSDVCAITLDQPSDREMAMRYAACDLTVLPSLGEGFGYPIVESLAVGTEVVHGGCGGGAELMPYPGIDVDAYRLDTRWCMLRPVFDPQRWTREIVACLENAHSRDTERRKLGAKMVEHLAWPKLWPGVWQKWFERGAEMFAEREAAPAGRAGCAE